jgi:predicted aldo/keto reductase-like oxidoreductase
MSGHGGRLVACVDYALDHELVDVLLLGYNFGQDPGFMQQFTARMDFVAVQPELPRVMAKAREQGVGVIAMKTLRGARLNDMRPYETGDATFAQAAFRWVLSGGLADALVVTMKSPEMVDEYLGASGWGGVSQADGALLARYERAQGSLQCRYGCDACGDACPEGVPIAEVLRTRMYAEDYADLELARSDYAALAEAASACVGCTHRACLDACPFGLAIPELTARTHRRLAGGDS